MTLPLCTLCENTSDPRMWVEAGGISYPLCDGCSPGRPPYDSYETVAAKCQVSPWQPAHECPHGHEPHTCTPCRVAKTERSLRTRLDATESALATLDAKRAELQERVDVAESKADACEQEMRLAHSRIRAVAHSACTSHMLDWSPEDIRKGLSCAEADRCSACRCQDFLNGKPDTDLDTALSLLRRVIAPLEREDEADFGATKADALDVEIVAFLSRFPADAAKAGAT